MFKGLLLILAVGSSLCLAQAGSSATSSTASAQKPTSAPTALLVEEHVVKGVDNGGIYLSDEESVDLPSNHPSPDHNQNWKSREKQILRETVLW